MASNFGTDGIRGAANTWPMTPDNALKVGQAAGLYFREKNRRNRAVIGKDTRLSSYMIENALTAGFLSVGVHVLLLGPVPTPAVSMLSASMRADLGVMISASHNSFQDNGIKIFSASGEKLSEAVEKEIDALINSDLSGRLASPRNIGRASRVDHAVGRYVEYAKRTLDGDVRLDNLRLVVDCANGASYLAGPEALWELGAEVIRFGVSPNGTNINRNCGATSPTQMVREVLQSGADAGIAFDGDADRLIMCDEKGKIIDGDGITAILARDWKADNRLSGNAVVSTVMANKGLEDYLNALGIELFRTSVGDRHVYEAMSQTGAGIGSEPSGHVILRGYSSNGDGLVTALQVLAGLKKSGKPLSEYARTYDPWPQIKKSCRLSSSTDPLQLETVKKSLDKIESEYHGRARILVRKSGTEPIIRIMVEGQDIALIEQVAEEIEQLIVQHA